MNDARKLRRKWLPRRRVQALLEGLEPVRVGVSVTVVTPEGEVYAGDPLPPDEVARRLLSADAGVAALRREGLLLGWLLVDAARQDVLKTTLALLEYLMESEEERRALAQDALDRYREINLLYNLSATLRTTPALDRLARTLLREVSRVLKADKGLMVLARGPEGVPWPAAATGLRPVSEFTPADWKTWSQALLSHPQVCHMPSTPPNETLETGLRLLGFRHAMCVPLRVEDEVQGVIVVGDKQGASIFTAGDEKLLLAVSEQVALFLKVARLYADLQDRNRELEQALRDLRAAQDELVRAERMSAIGSTASRIIHDLKGPMGVIKGYASMMLLGPVEESEVREWAQYMVEAVDGLLEMVQEILDFARGEAGLRLEEVRLQDLVDDLVKRVQPEMSQHGIELAVKIPDEPLFLRLDRGKMGRVLYNIAHNAMEAIRDRRKGDRFVVHVEREGAQVVIRLIDNGPGIPESIRETLFEPFVTHGKSRGTGLGLAIAKKIVTDHGGEIAVEDTPGGGATFVIRLPALGVDPKN